MTDSHEREDLESLCVSPGWQWFVAHALQEYDTDLLDKVTHVYDDPENKDGMAEDKLRQLLAVRREMRRMLEWPAKRVRDLSRAEHERDGRGQSRRGSL